MIALFGVTLLAGCSSPGHLVARHAGDGPGHVGVAPQSATYGLFMDGGAQPLTRVPVRAGQPLGFDLAGDATGTDLRIPWLISVAGDDRRRLDINKTYEWRRL